MRTKIVTEAWEFYRDNCPGFKEPMRKQLRKADKYVAELESNNAKLRELTQDMYGFIRRMDEECGDVTFSDCFDYCEHDTADDGCCKTGECWYERRMQELQDEIGVE